MYLDPNSYIYTLRGLKKVLDLKKGDIIKNSQVLITIDEFELKRNVDVCELTLEDNSKIYVHKNALVKKVDNSRVLIKNIEVGDYIKHTGLNYFNNKQGSPIDWENKIRTLAYPIKVPEKNNEKFCEWIGIFMAIGSKNQGSGAMIVDITNREFIAEYYRQLTKDVFDITPLLREDNGRKYLEFYSTNLLKFLNLNTGYKFKFRKVPNFLYSSSVNEILSFIKGLSLKGYFNEKKQNIIYNGNSKLIADFVQFFLKSIGVYTRIKVIDKKYFHVILTSFNGNSPFVLSTINPKLDFSTLKEKYLVKVIEDIDDYKISAKNTNRSYINKVKKEKRDLINASALRSLNVEEKNFDYFYLKVKNKKDFKKDMIYLSINKETYLELNNLMILQV